MANSKVRGAVCWVRECLIDQLTLIYNGRLGGQRFRGNWAKGSGTGSHGQGAAKEGLRKEPTENESSR